VRVAREADFFALLAGRQSKLAKMGEPRGSPDLYNGMMDCFMLCDDADGVCVDDESDAGGCWDFLA
jgi:hypothetical protein